MRDIDNIWVMPLVNMIAYKLPVVAPIVYFIVDCFREIKNERDVQIIFHHITSICLILQWYSDPQICFILFTILELSSYLIILGRITGSRIIKFFSKIFWIWIRLFVVNYIHSFYNYKFNIFFQIIKWLGYMWTLEIFKIKLKPCHISLFSAQELIIRHADTTTSIFCLILTIFSYFHHEYYENKILKRIDQTLVRLWVIYCTFRFYQYPVFISHLIRVLITCEIMRRTKASDRSWSNILNLLPHICMHMIAGKGICACIQ
jgi:hypothetical protein